MCGTQGRELIISAAARKRSANSMNRNWVGKEICFSIRGGSEKNVISSYGKDFNKQKGRIETIHRIHVCKTITRRLSTGPREIVMIAPR
jgi:hypothetical protein